VFNIKNTDWVGHRLLQAKVIPSVVTRFLGTFEKLTKSTVSFITSVRLSAWNNSAPTGGIFLKFDIWVFFENLSRNFKFR